MPSAYRSGGHGNRTRNPLRGTTFPVWPLAIRLPSGTRSKSSKLLTLRLNVFTIYFEVSKTTPETTPDTRFDTRHPRLTPEAYARHLIPGGTHD